MTTGKENAAVLQQSMEPSKAPVPATKIILDRLGDTKSIEAFKKVFNNDENQVNIFVQTVRNVVLDPRNKALTECTPNSILQSCMACATTGLRIDPAFGEAAIVPFKGKATFMPMRNGLMSLAVNSGLFKSINAAPVYEGYIKEYNAITGEITWDTDVMIRLKMNPGERILIGYSAYIETLAGYKHTLFWTIDEIKAHGKRYSKTYSRADGLWNTNFPAMAEKTMLRQILLKWSQSAPRVDARLAMALRLDGATPKDPETMSFDEATEVDYPDANTVPLDIDAEVVRDGDE